MDTITQSILGACFGNACARHKLGKRAARVGAMGGAIPDLDFLAALFGGPWASMQHHRGVTHALWFGPVVGSALGWLLWRRYAKLAERDPKHEDAPLGAPDRLRWWMLAVAVAIVTHPLLDLFTTYGTQLFAPLSDARLSVHAIGIIDPIYTLVLVAALLAGRKRVRRTMIASAAGIAITTGYLAYGIYLNHGAIAHAREQLKAEGVEQAEIQAYPRALQIFLRRVVARADGVLYVGQVSMWAPRPIEWHRLRDADDPLVARTRARAEGQLFEWFAMSQTLARTEADGADTVVEIDDMRYGHMAAPEVGMWGIRARYRDGELTGPIERFRRQRPAQVGAALRKMLRDTFDPP